MEPLFQGKDWLVRPITDADVADVLDVYRQCEDFLALGPVPRASAAMVAWDRAGSGAAGGNYCGIYTDGLLCGVLDIIPGYQGRPDEAFLELLMLARPYRGRGLGRQVVGALLAYLASQGIARVRAGVQVNNPAALLFWQQMGFSVVGGPERMEDQTTVWHLLWAGNDQG